HGDPAQRPRLGGAVARHAGTDLRPSLSGVASLYAARRRDAAAGRPRREPPGMSDHLGPRAKRPPLGRGLAALFGEVGTRLSGEPGGARPGGAQIVPIESIRPSP